MANHLFEKAVDKLFANKQFTLGYEFTTYSLFGDYEICHLQVLTPEEHAKLCSLRDKYDEDEIYKHVDEVLDEEGFNDYTCGGALTGLNLDDAYKLYEFGIHSLLDDGTLRHTTLRVCLRDEDYKNLLILMIKDQSLNFNALEYADKDMYDFIKHQISNRYFECNIYKNPYPFLVTFDEPRRDVEKILSEHPMWKQDSELGYTRGCGPAQPQKYFCTVSVFNGDKPTSIDDVKGVLHGTLHAIIDKIPGVYVHSSHNPALKEYMEKMNKNNLVYLDFIVLKKLDISIPDTDITYHFNLFFSDIEEDRDRIVSRVTVLYDDVDPMADGIPFRILDVYTRASGNDDTNQGREAFAQKDFFLNAL